MMEGWDSASWSENDPQEDQVRTLTVNGHEVISRAQIVMGRLCHYGTLIRGHSYWQYYYFQLKFDYVASYDPTTFTPTTSPSKPTNNCGADHPSGSMGDLSFPINIIVQRPLRKPALWGSNSIFFLHLSHAQALYGNPTRSSAEGVE